MSATDRHDDIGQDRTASPPSSGSDRRSTGVAQDLEPLARGILGGQVPLRIRGWDGSEVGPADSAATVIINSPDALRRILYAPNELGLARAYVVGDLDLEGDIFALLGVRDAIGGRKDRVDLGFDRRAMIELWKAARRHQVIGRPLAPPAEEARLSGRLHTRRRDADAVSHHYDVGNDFYRLILGETMTYSCGYWPREQTTLHEAQDAKYDLICAKLGLRPGQRLLDVGCGWGGMVLHAAQQYGVQAVGVTISQEQRDLATERVVDAGLGHLIEIRFQDYREVDDGPYDAISSIGMFEHVGIGQAGDYFARLVELLKPGGRLLNHAISRPEPSSKPAIDRHSFLGRYVFPDGELIEVGTIVSTMQSLGLEVRDVESLREHYGRTLRAWVDNLEDNWDEAIRLVGPARARIWRLYMAGTAVGFEENRTNVHQVLAVLSDEKGRSHLPPTREWLVQPP